MADPLSNETHSGPDRMLAERRVTDASARQRFQHEYAVEGFKTLTLINGGAVIALLTYAGHSPGSNVASHLSHAFFSYMVGVAISVLAYLFAYLSQGELMNSDTLHAYRLLNVNATDGSTPEKFEKRGTVWIAAGIALSIVSLGAFLAGSWFAMLAIS